MERGDAPLTSPQAWGQGFGKAQLPACGSCKLDQSRGVGLAVGSDLGGVRSRCPTRNSAFAIQLMVTPASSLRGHTQTKAWAEPSASLGRLGSKLWAVAVSVDGKCMCGAGAEVTVAEKVMPSNKSRQWLHWWWGGGSDQKEHGGFYLWTGVQAPTRSVCEIRELSAEEYVLFSIFVFPCRRLFS